MTHDMDPLADMVTATMTAAVVVVDGAMTTVEDTAEMIVTVAMAVIATTDTPHEELIVMPARTDTAAVAAMIDVEAVADTLIVTIEVIVALASLASLAILLHQPPMVIQLLVEMLGNHTEVDATMMRDTPLGIIDR
jgi:hypothetical protein